MQYKNYITVAMKLKLKGNHTLNLKLKLPRHYIKFVALTTESSKGAQ